MKSEEVTPPARQAKPAVVPSDSEARRYPHQRRNEFFWEFLVGAALLIAAIAVDFYFTHFTSTTSQVAAELVIILGFGWELGLYVVNEVHFGTRTTEGAGQTLQSVDHGLSDLKLSTGELTSSVKAVRTDVDRELQQVLEFARNNDGLEYTPGETNLQKAISLLESVGNEDEVWETSSHRNEEAYEAKFVAAVGRGAKVHRLMCFRRGDSRMEQWQREMLMDPGGADLYKGFRNSIRAGRSDCEHLPYELAVDLLIIEPYTDLPVTGLVGFRTRQRSQEGGYASGVFIGRVRGHSLAKDLRGNVFQDYWEEAKVHRTEESTARPSEKCACLAFVNRRVTRP